MTTDPMVDLAAACGYVAAHGDNVDRARLAYLRTGAAPEPAALAEAAAGQLPAAGWPGRASKQVPSIDATCYRLAILDDLGALGRPAAGQALDWLAGAQRPDGTWEEDPALAGAAPWAAPGVPEARLYLTANAAFWLCASGLAQPGGERAESGGDHASAAEKAAAVIAASLAADGTWPSYLVTGWLGAAVLFGQGRTTESSRMRAALHRRLGDIGPDGVAWLACALRRLGLPAGDDLLVAARARLAATQRSDGSWSSDDGDPFVVHTTLTAIRACR